MSEKETSERKVNPEWESQMREGVAMAIENYELFDKLAFFAPLTISDGLDEREWHNLSEAEKEIILGEVFSLLEVDPKTQEPVKEYEFAAPTTDDPKKETTWTGTGKVKVYETGKSDEDMFLHELDSPGLGLEYFIAPREFEI